MAATNSDNDRRIDYVEFDVADVAGAKKFYGDVFGWTLKDYGPGYCECRDGRLTGGFAGAGKTRGAGGPLVILTPTTFQTSSAASRRPAVTSSRRPTTSPAAAVQRTVANSSGAS